MKRPILRPLACLVALLAVSLFAGFGWFVHDAGRPRPISADADGIVVLTGGALRVETGLALLEAGVAPRLLISGVGDGVTIADVVGSAGLPIAPDAERPARGGRLFGRPVLDLEPARGDITLGRLARTTEGNAAETASWARRSGLRSLVVVTAGYHMRRALDEIGALLPDVTLHPFPVHPRASFRLLGVEYLKLLAVELGAGSTAEGRANT